MKKLSFLLTCLISLVFINYSNGQEKVSFAVNDMLVPAISAQIYGYAGCKLDSSYQNRILAQDVDRLISPFRNRTEDRCWQSEFWGKWFTSAVLAYRYRPEPQLKVMLEQAVSGLLSTQSADGYIGNYTDEKRLDQWDIWGRKYCMLGLLAYYDLTKDKNSLMAARKLADNLISELKTKNVLVVKMGNHHGMAATSILEPICLLYARTAYQPYLEFAEEIVSQWESPDGPQLISKSGIDVSQRFPKPQNWWGWEQGQKAYEMMSCYEGLLELYRLTGKPEYLEAVEKTWKNIFETEISITGSGSGMECWFGGKKLQTMHVDHYQETCVTATWIRLSQQLLRLTGESGYADAIEQSWYNALLGAMFSGASDWAKYSPLSGQRLQGSEQCGMGINCCVASGPRALFTLPLTAVMSDKEGISINFYAEGNYRVQTPRGKLIELLQQTDYPVSGNITMKVVLSKEEQFTVSIRIPLWSQQSELTINGQPFTDVIPGKYAEISRTWKSGDLIRLSLDMRGRIVRMGNIPENIAIVRGPIVLARDARLGEPHVDETIKPVTDKEGFINLLPAGLNQDDIWMRYKGRFMVESQQEGGNQPVEIVFCDYSSAGNTLNEQSWFRVWLPQSFNPAK